MTPWLGIYFATILACGAAIAAWVYSRQRVRLIELMSLSLALGCGAVPVLLIWISMIGLRPGRGIILLLFAASVLAIAGQVWRGRAPVIARPWLPKLGGIDLLLLPVIALLAVQFAALVASSAMIRTYDTDAIAIWGLKAKVLFHAPLRPVPAYFNDRSLSYSHLDYPLLVPMLWAGSYMALGQADDQIGKAVFALPVLAMIGLLYSALRDPLGRTRAAILAGILSGLPALTRWAGEGGADVPLSMFILAAAVMLTKHLRGDRRACLIALALFCGMAWLTKLEGRILAISAMLVLARMFMLRRDRRSALDALIFLSLLVAMLVPWTMWSWSLPDTHERYASRLTIHLLTNGIQRIPILFRLLRENLLWWVWTAPAAILVVAGAVGWRAWSRSWVIATGAILTVQIGAYIIAYMITPWDLASLVPMTANRLLLHVAPVGLLLAGLCWEEARP